MDRQSILQVSGEEEPARVYKVELSNRHIRKISLVREFDKLRCLVLSYNLISRLQNLEGFPDLRELHVESNGIERLGGLEGNKWLQVLNLRGNSIQRIQNIGHLIKLETLIIDHNAISKLSGLEYLKDLKNLYASHNAIESLENLPSFSKLQHLTLSHNRIAKVPAALFTSSKGIVSLDLSHNRIELTSFLQQLVGLEQLNLSHNRIRQLNVVTMVNLQSFNVSDNQLEKLPPIGASFPELISLNLQSNMICSELDIIEALADTEYLTEVDFRNNPMFTQAFEAGLQKVHNFDFLNGKAMTRAGAKYYDQISKIQGDLQDNRELYGEDDQKDREIKMSGFYDAELQFRMTGMKVTRPQSPSRKKKNLDKPTFYQDIDKTYLEFTANDLRIKVIREQYLKICGQYDIKGSVHILTEVPQEAAERPSQSDSLKEEADKSSISQQLCSSENEIRKENEKNLNQWKELKQREKSFNIRDVIRKSRGKDSSMSRGVNSSTNSNWNGDTGVNSGTNPNWNRASTNPNWSGAGGVKPEKLRNELLRTQGLPRKFGQEQFKATLRPRSMHKKE